MSCCSYWLAYAEGKRIQTLPKLTNFSRRVVSFGAKHRPFPRSRRHAPLAPPCSPSFFVLLLFLVHWVYRLGRAKLCIPPKTVTGGNSVFSKSVGQQTSEAHRVLTLVLV